MPERSEVKALTTQLAIRVSEELAAVFEPAGLTLSLLLDSFESHFDEIWPVQRDESVQTTQNVCPVPPTQNLQTPSSVTTFSPPAVVTCTNLAPPVTTRPDVTGLMRCGSATLLGFRCSRRIVLPYTVCDVHLKYFYKHQHLPAGGSVSPESIHPEDDKGVVRGESSGCTCQIVRHICKNCEPQLRS